MEVVSIKDKLAIFDLDGTLFDTRRVNYLAYRKALDQFGIRLDYDFFSAKCNGRHYKDFLPQIMDNVTDAGVEIEEVHKLKKEYYSCFLSEAVSNERLFDMIEALRATYYIALVTTASRKNCDELLSYYGKEKEFDLLITAEDVQKKKPDPEGFLKAMRFYGVSEENTIVFEDSAVGIAAAEKCGATVFAARGFA